MSNLLENCAICLSSNEKLIQISETDTNQVKWSNKLSLCVPKIDWENDCCICPNCIGHLEISYTFTCLCFQSYEVRKQAVMVKTEELVESDFIVKTLNEEEIKGSVNDISVDSSKFNSVQIKECFKNEDVEAFDLKTEKVCDSNPLNDTAEIFFDLKLEECLTNGQDNSMKSKIIKKYLKKCEHCSKHFKSKQHLETHFRRFHTLKSNRTFICSFCGKMFGTSTCLSHHTQTHLNKREYKCNVCEKRFNTASTLRTHNICVHMDPGLWKYPCTFCEKRFPMKSGLTAHIRRHTGEKNFVCHICMKRFVDKDSLLNHIRSHTDERLFKCHLCEKEYKAKRALTIHLKREHDLGTTKLPKPRKKHECQQCPKTFCTKSKLEKHIRSHTGEKPFSCNICKKKFTEGWYLRVHLKNKHEGDSVGGDLDKN